MYCIRSSTKQLNQWRPPSISFVYPDFGQWGFLLTDLSGNFKFINRISCAVVICLRLKSVECNIPFHCLDCRRRQVVCNDMSRETINSAIVKTSRILTSQVVFPSRSESNEDLWQPELQESQTCTAYTAIKLLREHDTEIDTSAHLRWFAYRSRFAVNRLAFMRYIYVLLDFCVICCKEVIARKN